MVRERDYSMMITKNPEWTKLTGYKKILVTDILTGIVTRYPSVKDTAKALEVEPSYVSSSLRQRYNILKRYRCEYEA